MWFMLQDFQQVQASVLQVARTPGKMGGVRRHLAGAGVLAMLYVRERRLWIWLVPTIIRRKHRPMRHPAMVVPQALLAYSCARRNHDSAQEFARLAASLLQKGQDDNIIR